MAPDVGNGRKDPGEKLKHLAGHLDDPRLVVRVVHVVHQLLEEDEVRLVDRAVRGEIAEAFRAQSQALRDSGRALGGQPGARALQDEDHAEEAHRIKVLDIAIDVVDHGLGRRPRRAVANRLGVAAASERVQVRDNLPFSVRGGRLVVFGSGDMVANNRIVNAGNLNIFLGAVNWAVDRDTLLNVPARPIERFQLSLSQQDLMRLRYSILLVVPGIAALLGLAVYWSRRK